MKIFFRPGVDIRTATAQVTSASQTVLKQMPPGITPPLILNYNASTVPILQLALSGRGLSEQKIYDLGQNMIRPALASVQGAAIPSPYGGKERQIQIDLDPAALQAHRLSATDVANALAQQNQIVPAGTAKIGQYEYNLRLNNSPNAIDELNDLPIKTIGGTTVLIRDVAHVRDTGGQPLEHRIQLRIGAAFAQLARQFVARQHHVRHAVHQLVDQAERQADGAGRRLRRAGALIILRI